MARSSQTHELSMLPSDCDDVIACKDGTWTESPALVSGSARGLLWKPYLTVVEAVVKEAIMLWSIQFVVEHGRPILQSQQTGRKIVDSQPVIGQIGGGCSQYSVRAWAIQKG